MINGEGGGFLLGMSWAEKCEGGGGREEESGYDKSNYRNRIEFHRLLNPVATLNMVDVFSGILYSSYAMFLQ